MNSVTAQRKTRILYLVTEDWYFCLHRLPIAIEARAQGWDVFVATRVRNHAREITDNGLGLVPLDWDRRSLNPLRAITDIWKIGRLYRSLKPDLVHHIAVKPSVFGSIAAMVTGIRPVVNNLAGLGFAFSSTSASARLLRHGLVTAFRWLFNGHHTTTILENRDDLDFLHSEVGIKEKALVLIQGIGVDVARFSYVPEPTGTVVITMVSRMLWPKGVGVLVEAARLLQSRRIPHRILLVGTPDPDNPESVSAGDLERWTQDGLIEWLGYRDDIPDIWKKSNIAVLPSSYREGVPRCLLEAAASGRPIITTDMPGCREIVQQGYNGLLVPPGDARALAAALERMIGRPDLRRDMGLAGRECVTRDFAEAQVVERTIATYNQLLEEKNGEA